MGGTDALDKARNECYKLNLKTQEIEQMSSMLDSRLGFGLCFIGNHIYVMGGSNELVNPITCEKYDMETNKWSYFKSLPYKLWV